MGFMIRTAISEAQLEKTEAGLVSTGPGWFVFNAREAGRRLIATAGFPGKGNYRPCM
jgi:hypothetical protein